VKITLTFSESMRLICWHSKPVINSLSGDARPSRPDHPTHRGASRPAATSKYPPTQNVFLPVIVSRKMWHNRIPITDPINIFHPSLRSRPIPLLPRPCFTNFTYFSFRLVFKFTDLQCTAKNGIVTKVGGDQIRLVPTISKSWMGRVPRVPYGGCAYVNRP